MKEPPNKRVDASIAWYKRFLDWAEHRWQSQSPGSHRLFRTFKAGASGLVTDFQDFVTVWTRVSAGGAPYADLSCREISLLRLVPRELLRATPALCVSVLPGTFLLLPVLFYFPRLFLTEHFWTPEQRAEFSAARLKHRRANYPRVLDDLGLLLPKVGSEPLKLAVENARSGRKNSVELLVSTAPAFGHNCLQIEYLTYRHAIHLSRSIGVSPLRLYREYRLWRLAKILFEEDRALEREWAAGRGVAGFRVESSSSSEQQQQQQQLLLREQYCLARGLLPTSAVDSADDFARDWCRVSAAAATADAASGTDDHSRRLSMLLHLPCLFFPGRISS